jgi:hypothetical protein
MDTQVHSPYVEQEERNMNTWIIGAVAVGAALGIGYAAYARRTRHVPWTENVRTVATNVAEHREEIADAGRHILDRLRIIFEEGRKVVEDAQVFWSEGRRILRR